MREKIEQALRDYHWMVIEIQRLQSTIYSFSSNSSSSSGLVSQYGIEAIMPKPKGTNYHAMEFAERREERTLRRLQRLEEKVEAIDLDSEAIQGEIHAAVLDLILRGVSYRGISKVFGFSRKKVFQIKEEIIDQLSQKSHIAQVLTSEKCAC